MTIAAFLGDTAARLRAAGITSARLDALVLLEDVLGEDRAVLLAHTDRTIPPAALRSLNKKCTQRMKHVPLAYTRGMAPFYGRNFIVTPDVLVPRPESESLISLLLRADPHPGSRILDIGTGSGCLGITAALELRHKNPEVTLIDVGTAALNVARRNIPAHCDGISLLKADLLAMSALPKSEIILANLPYVPNDYPVNEAASHEPELALYSGSDGLTHYRRLWQLIRADTHKPHLVITESLESQHAALEEIAETAGYTLRQTSGLAQLFIPLIRPEQRQA